ncbi:MAG: transposase [Myxococcaceae bacterium]
MKQACQDLDLLRQRLLDNDRDIETKLDAHEIGSLLTTIDGIGPTTAATLIVELGNPADFST